MWWISSSFPLSVHACVHVCMYVYVHAHVRVCMVRHIIMKTKSCKLGMTLSLAHPVEAMVLSGSVVWGLGWLKPYAPTLGCCMGHLGAGLSPISSIKHLRIAMTLRWHKWHACVVLLHYSTSIQPQPQVINTYGLCLWHLHDHCNIAYVEYLCRLEEHI